LARGRPHGYWGFYGLTVDSVVRIMKKMITMVGGSMDRLKPYQLDFRHYETYLYAFVSGGRDSLEISIAYWREIGQECRRFGHKRLLVEEDFPNAISDEDMVRLISNVPEELLGVKIAFFDRHVDHNNLLGEFLAGSRGIIGRVFFNLDDARTWLLSDVQTV
jgi:hypothetical protein